MIMIAGIILVTGVFIMVIFNRLVRFKMLMAEALSGIDVQLKRRYDLIPNIVEAVKGYMKYERDVLEQITGLRAIAMNASGRLQDKSEIENRLSAAVKHVLVLAENYPDLKASENFLGLQSALIGVEDELQLARRYFNGTVRNYNILVQSFPGNIVAMAFRYTSAEFFEIEYATERQNPDVRFV